MVEAARGRRRRITAAGAVAVALLGGVALRDEEGGPPPFSARPGPATYRLVYRVDVLQDPPSTTFEERLVRRPFDGRVLGAPDTGFDALSTDVGGTMSLQERVYVIGGGPNRIELVQQRVPTAAIGDQSLATVLDEAAAVGQAERVRPDDVVLGRRCRQFAVAEPGERVLQPPTEDSRTTICIDEAGTVLRERWELHGETVLVRTAVQLDENPSDAAIARALHEPAGATAAAPGGMAVRHVDRLDTFLAEPPRPDGFVLEGRYETAVIDRVLGALQSSVWVMRRGADFLVVEAGNGRIDLGGGIRTVAAGVGDGVLYLGSAGAEVRIAVDEDRWVRVSTSGPVPWAESYAASLHVEP